MAIDSKNLLVALKSFARANALPLDATELYDSRDAANKYLAQANSYAGQTIKIFENGKYVSYTIQPSTEGYYLEPLGTTEVETEGIKQKSMNDWLQESNAVYPAGTLLVYTDRTYKDGVPVPDIKIANGVSTVSELPFLTNDNIEDFLTENSVSISNGTISATTFNGALSHSLTIGTFTYDGSAEVVVPVYYGE